MPRFDPSGTVFGGGFSVGTWLTPRVTVRLEAGFPAFLGHDTQSPNVVQTIGGAPFDYRSELHSRERSNAFSTLVGYHTERRRGIQLGYVGGAAFLSETRRLRLVSTVPVYDPSLPGGSIEITSAEKVLETTTTTYTVSVAVGMDADIAIGTRVSAVPQIRLMAVGNGLSLRPGVGIRARW